MAAFSMASRPGPPRLMLMTTGEAASGPAFSCATYRMPRAMTDDQPKPAFLSTFTGMIVALVAAPLMGTPPRLYPITELVTCVPWEFWSCCQQLVGADTLPVSPPPPLKHFAYWVATRCSGKYCRHESSRPVWMTAT